MLQEPIITKRAERYVVPLKAEYKGRMQCVVQDQSASGATLFVEPLSVVELNNDRISLSKAEQEEVQRILVELSGRIGAHARAIQELVHQLAVLDLAFACAKYAFALKAAAPILVPFPQEPAVLPDPILRITQARHPLLDPKTVVPIDIFLEKGTRALVITGPNTGGKTISLKTAGLMALMAQSGLHIPAQSGSQLCVFKNVYADIGDEQSIEQSLSTFSGHVTNIVRILKKANRKTLVLLDELGAGTDPQEGSALARAILTFMIRRHIPTLVATHYPELKAFAHNADGVLNASVEFDADTLMPTYRLLTGVPGRSNALAIAKQLGVSAEILDDARAMIDPNDLQADQLLDGIQEQLEQARVERARAEMLRVEIEDAKHELQLHLSGIEEERLKVLDDARQQAEAEAEKLYAEINAIRKETGKPEKTTQKKKELRKRVDKLKGELNEPLERTRFQEEGRRPLREGDRVRVRKLDTDGTVVGILDGSVEVQVGKMRMKVDVGDIERSKRPEKIEKSPASGHAIVEASDIFSPSPGTELMLIGMNSEDALMTLDRYLDAAHAAGLPYVRIVHGKGTGTLRRAVRKALGGSRLVVRWERALDAEGGEGATVAFLEDTS